MDAHELVAAVKQMALELGRTPTRIEFEGSGRGFKHQTSKVFGNYSALLQASGLETYSERRKVTNQVFHQSLSSHLNEYKAAENPVAPFGVLNPLPPETSESILSISDIHWPFENAKLVQKFLERVAQVRPDWVVLNGDAWDMYSHSKFPRSHNLFTPREEEERSREANVSFWKAVFDRSPKSKGVQLLGNHDLRPLKQVLERYPSAEDWVTRAIHANFTFENVRTIFDHREELIIGNIAVFHGYRSQLGAHRDYTLMNCINGHTHVGGVVFRQIQGRVLWELNSGFAGNPEAKGLTYTPQRISKWTAGWAEKDAWGPRFVPYVSC